MSEPTAMKSSFLVFLTLLSATSSGFAKEQINSTQIAQHQNTRLNENSTAVKTESSRIDNFMKISSEIYRIAMKNDLMIYATVIKKGELPDVALVQIWTVNRVPDEKGEKYTRTLDLFDCKERSTSLLYLASYDAHHNLLIDSLPMFNNIKSTPGSIDDDWMKLVCDGVKGWTSVTDPVLDAQRIFDVK